MACTSSWWPQRKASATRPTRALFRERSSAFVRASWSAAAQASATAKAASDSRDANGKDSYGGRIEMSESAQRPAIVSEIREVQLQVGVGTQRPSQTSMIDPQATDAIASVSAVRVLSQVATIAAAHVLAASASREASERRAAEAK